MPEQTKPTQQTTQPIGTAQTSQQTPTQATQAKPAQQTTIPPAGTQTNTQPNVQQTAKPKKTKWWIWLVIALIIIVIAGVAYFVFIG